MHIVDFNESAIKKSPSVEAEMSRLKHHLLPSMPNLKCASLPDFYVTITLLNVRSINAKVQDIMKDKMLKYASVLCFCETWLNPSQPDPKLLDNHTVMRTDRDANNSKGGVMMSIDNTKHPVKMYTVSLVGLEALVVRLTMPSESFLQVALIYRAPTSIWENLEPVFTHLLNELAQTNIDTIVLGDFNEDLLKEKTSKVYQFMTNHCYAQLVHTPTTDRATLIDHIYYSGDSENTVVEVRDAYYSDHDIVYCSIKY